MMHVVKDVMVILAEREANRILLSADNTARNIFIEKELPKNVLQSTWFDFLIDQIEKRWRIKAKLFKIVPSIFDNWEQDFYIRLTNFMFLEIKRKRITNITMTKSHRDLVWFTDFQELVYRHSFGEITSKYDPIIITEEYAEIAQGNKDSLIQEIIEKDEIPIFKEYRWYKNSQEVDAIVPKSLILSFLFCFDQFLQSHCQTIGKSIASKCSVETFLDEYNARWYSFTSLIQIFEVELQVIVDIVNEACKHPLISVDLIYPGYSQPTKFSIMRMMCRSWGKYVMKSVYEMFMTKITWLIVDYQKKLISLIHEYDELKSTKKYFDNFIDNEYTFSQTSNDVLRHSMLWILDCKWAKILNNI